MGCGCGDCEEMMQPYMDGMLSDEEVAELYRRCRAVLFPGLEDFGIVPLEAMAAGRPVIAFAGGGALETVVPPERDRPPTGLFFDVQTVDALAEVPHDFRDVIVLVDIGEFSYADTAQILDIPVGTVMSRLHRGRRILKQQLADKAVSA